ncbi:YidB family protein [Xenorhabdus bovienii]|uniref:YidB family protein n=1 Tax=Xenorhabdus bovienii TaxID=40576 RepID=UPI0023B2E12C|nr:YidB family protein [Xenorhabdus bovienii]MDE9454452.1 YidB family protein [Xenorhabdus bovienii]
MGFFDQITNMLNGGKNQQLQHMMDWVEGQGGISGLIEKFSQQGLGGTIHSWIDSGENSPIHADQISSIFGSSTIQQLAQKMGIDPSEASSLISQHLPSLIDKVTPNGEIPENLDLKSAGMNLLKDKLLGK